jgi:AraC-like DNA-binding protein
VSFAELLDALRCDMAKTYLSGGRLSVNETAYLLGFSEPSAFSRSFKRWTGTHPRGWKAGA